LRIAIISVGREILRGRVLDTNSNYLARELTALGHQVVRISQIDDIREEIIWEVKYAASSPVEVIITTGGLGPTSDDITIPSIAAAFDTPCFENKEALKIVEERYRYFYEKGAVESPDLTPERKKMACFPEGAVPLFNNVGAAPGMKWEKNGITIYSLPGVPAEMKYIFENHIKPDLEERNIYRERFVETPCRDESLLEKYISDFKKRNPDIYIKSVPEKFGKEVRIKVVIGMRGDREKIEELLTSLAGEFLKSIREPC